MDRHLLGHRSADEIGFKSKRRGTDTRWYSFLIMLQGDRRVRVAQRRLGALRILCVITEQCRAGTAKGLEGHTSNARALGRWLENPLQIVVRVEMTRTAMPCLEEPISRIAFGRVKLSLQLFGEVWGYVHIGRRSGCLQRGTVAKHERLVDSQRLCPDHPA
jgi:hypothetical protein